MIELFRNWISSILMVGILFTLIKMILPNTNLKKYISSLIGIVTIIVILNPVLSIINSDKHYIDEIVLNATNYLEKSNINYTDISNYEDINKNNVKETFKSSIEKDIVAKVKKNISNDVDVDIKITDSYNIDKISLTLYGDTSFDVKTFVSNEYDVDKSNITIQKGG